MKYVRAILTGEQKDLQKFVELWFKDEAVETPEIGAEVDVYLNIPENTCPGLVAMAGELNLETYFFD